MEITLYRKELVGATAGELYLGAVGDKSHFICHTLEDMCRPVGEFVYGVTAIPYGRYRIIIDFSNRFQKPMCHIICDQGKTIMFGNHSIDAAGIRIHGGNKTEDTLGCLLVGENRNTDGVGIFNCAPAVQKVFDLVNANFMKEVVYLNIGNA